MYIFGLVGGWAGRVNPVFFFSCKAHCVEMQSFYTGMDKTSLYTSSGSLFVRDSLTLSGCPRHVGCNYVPLLFGVETIE